jgi:hypothetical protein
VPPEDEFTGQSTEIDGAPPEAPVRWWVHWWAQVFTVAILRPWRVALTLIGALSTPYYFGVAVGAVIRGGSLFHLVSSWLLFLFWLGVTFLAFRWAQRATRP